MAERIVVNAKCQRPGVCNAAESLLVHARRGGDLSSRSLAKSCSQHGVEVCAAAPKHGAWLPAAARDGGLTTPPNISI